MRAINVGLLGFGTVGAGIYTVLLRNREEILRRAGHDIQIKAIGARRVECVQKQVQTIHQTFLCAKSKVLITDCFDQIINDDEIDIVIEAIGGVNDAKSWVMAAIANGKHVITANKALLALHGNQIFAAAHQAGVVVAYEAAVAGGIPIIKALREGLAANRIESIVGIINGTTNYILSAMSASKINFNEALEQAQKLGFAEADPSFDIDGIDAAHKISLMSAIAYGIPVPFEHTYIEGIRHLETIDIDYANQLGFRIKLLGITHRSSYGIELRVHPALISTKHSMAMVDGAMNAISVHANAVGTTLYCGKGAGGEPTASAVLADLIDLARLYTASPEHRVPSLAFQADQVNELPLLDINQIRCAYYFRLRVADKLGILARITQILAKANISIDMLLQKASGEADNKLIHIYQHTMDLVFITHPTQESQANQALAEIKALESVIGSIVRLRIQAFDD